MTLHLSDRSAIKRPRKMQLAAKVTLHDVNDVEAFVRATITKGRLRLTLDEREELVAEGLVIMARLSNSYEPGRNGLDATQSKFSGYAAKFLPGKLSDAWHRLQENHRLVTLPTGERKWQYDQKASSLDAQVEDTGVDHIEALQCEDAYSSDMANTLRQILEERWPQDRETTVKVGVLMGLGIAPGKTAKMLGITEREATMAVERITVVRNKLKQTLLAA